MHLRERDITVALTEEQLEVWVPWAIGGLELLQVARLRGHRAATTRRLLNEAQERLRIFISSHHMSWMEAKAEAKAQAWKGGRADHATTNPTARV